SMRVLARAWQMLLKGAAEVEDAGRPLAAAEMVLVRLAYAADLPTPDDVIRSLEDGDAPAPRNGGTAQAARPRPPSRVDAARAEVARGEISRPQTTGHDAPRMEAARGGSHAALSPLARSIDQPAARVTEAAASATALVINRFEELIALAAQKRDIAVKAALERDVRLVHCEDGRLEIALEKSAAKMLVNDLARKFSEWTNRRWMVVVSAEAGEPTVRFQIE